LLVGQITSNPRRGDLGDLVPVDESMALFRAHDDPVELVELGYLQNVNDLPELGAGRTKYRSSIGEGKIRDWFSFIHDDLLCGRPSKCEPS
jgi:hypothetical protein